MNKDQFIEKYRDSLILFREEEKNSGYELYRKFCNECLGLFYDRFLQIEVERQFDFSFVIKETLDKPFIYLGMIAFFIILFMAITSTKNLYRKYNKYHKFVYLFLILITIHWIMAQKAISILQFSYILTILVIGYYKLLQQIINNSRS